MKITEVDKAVETMCKSLREDPDRWKITTHTLVDKKTGIQYWLSSYSNAITQIWNGHSKDTVFTQNQGVLIAQALRELETYKASCAQEKVVKSLSITSLEQKPWYKFW